MPAVVVTVLVRVTGTLVVKVDTLMSVDVTKEIRVFVLSIMVVATAVVEVSVDVRVVSKKVVNVVVS